MSQVPIRRSVYSMNIFFVYCSCLKCLRGRRCVTEEGVFYRFHRPGGCVSSRSLPEPSHLTARRGGVSAEPTGAYNICDPSSRKCFDRALMSFSELCSIVKSFLGLSSIIKSTLQIVYAARCCFDSSPHLKFQSTETYDLMRRSTLAPQDSTSM